MYNIQLEIWITILNIILVLALLAYIFYIRNLNTNKFIYMWLFILFLINIVSIRYSFTNFLNTSEKMGVEGKQGLQGKPGEKGSNKLCGCIGNNDANRLKLIEIKGEIKGWIDLILSYDKGVEFLENHFYIQDKWEQLLDRPRETVNPFSIIKTSKYFEIYNL